MSTPCNAADNVSVRIKETRNEAKCFLRAPPFPGISPAVASVAKPAISANQTDYSAVFVAIRAARVGGAFWAPPVPATGPTDGVLYDPWSLLKGGVVEVDNADTEQAIVGWIAGVCVVDRCGNRIDPEYLAASAANRIDRVTYRDPFTGRPIDVFAAIKILAHWRSLIDANRAIRAITGVAPWKREVIARFLWNGENTAPFLANDQAVARAQLAGGSVAYWPSRTSGKAVADARAAGVPAWQVEDGFVRSDGLGVECRPPYSILVDRSGGIHYDPATPSELETILSNTEFAPVLLRRAAALRRLIVAERISKYGVDHGRQLIDLPVGRRIVLAVGQVENDLSVQYGGGKIRSNLAFLHQVRAYDPDAYIIYRPHPDVRSGLRAGHVPVAAASAIVDRIDEQGSLLSLIEAADCVHVLSSLTGFEALLRRCPVVVHGLPFYAGWGLTTDLATPPHRRTRRLSLDALVAGALILAPRYLDPVTKLPCQIETLIDRIAAGVPGEAGLLTRFRQALGATRRSVAVVRDHLR